MRFRKAFSLLPGVRMNVGTGGPSLTVGAPGAAVNLGRKGARATVGVPGTGISHSVGLDAETMQQAAEVAQPRPWSPLARASLVFLRVVSLLVGVVGLALNGERFVLWGLFVVFGIYPGLKHLAGRMRGNRG